MSALQQMARQPEDVHDGRVVAAKVVYPARPREGVDLGRLRIEIMTRFQRTLAYLAK